VNILVVNPPIRLHDSPRHIPHGLAIIANIIRKNISCKINFIDWNAYRYSEKKFQSIVQSLPCDIALLGGIITTYKYIIQISDTIKQIYPNSTVIAGGSAAMSVPETLLKNSNVDIICMSEGELIIVDLIRLLKEDKFSDLSSVNGIAYKNSENIIIMNKPKALIDNLDLYSELPAYDLLPINDVYLKNPTVGIGKDIDFISGRGCPFHCSFCYQPWGRKNRRHSNEYIMDAISYLKKLYSIDFIAFQDDLFIMNKKTFFEFCQLRNRYFPEILWSCPGRANICDEEIIRAARESGCTLISYGFESGSPRILKKMKKAITIDQMENIVALSRKYNLPIPVSFILGHPGEDEESCNETLTFCKNNNLTLDSLMFATPYPGTELFEFAIETKRINKDRIHDFVLKLADARDFVINLTDYFSDQELKMKYAEMIETAKKNYVPIPEHELTKKMDALYGKLSIHLRQLSDSDNKHRQKHGAMSLF